MVMEALGPSFIVGLYRHYGEAGATDMLGQYLIVRLQRINTMLASGVEKERLEKARRKLEILMRNSMEDLRTLGLAKKVFPKLRMVIATFCLLQPARVKGKTVWSLDGCPITTIDERIEDNPLLPTLEWLLEELRTRPDRRKVQKALDDLTRAIENMERRRRR